MTVMTLPWPQDNSSQREPALCFDVLEKTRTDAFDLASPRDFKVGSGQPIAEEVILRDPGISLYCVDPERPRVLFTRCPTCLPPDQQTFYYQGQYTACRQIVSVPFAAFHRMAESLPCPDETTTFIHSTGRCGSTLMSRAFAAIGNVASVSEPDFLTKVTNLRSPDGRRDRDIADLCESAIRFQCKPGVFGGSLSDPPRPVLKFRSQVMEVADLLQARLPRVKTVFLYREPLAWLRSFLQSLLRNVEFTEIVNQQWERALAPCHPLIAQYHNPDRALSPAQLWIIDWVSSMERCLDLQHAGDAPLVLRYEDLRLHPLEAVKRTLEYLNMPLSAPDALRATLKKDSQAGTAISRQKAEQANAVPEIYFEQARQLLATRPRLQATDFCIPGTLSVTG